MEADSEKFLRLLFQIFREFREELGAAAWVILGLALATGIWACFFALRWMVHGGLRPGARQRFFARRRGIAQYLRKDNE